jgi:Spy/CpxP family protein refolding chaperone
MFKTMIISILAILAFSVMSYSQPRMSPQDRAKNLKEKLSLTDDQTAKVEKLFTDAQEKMKNLSDRSEFRKVMDETNSQVVKLLNDKQKTEYQKMLDERKSNMQKRQDKQINQDKQNSQDTTKANKSK